MLAFWLAAWSRALRWVVRGGGVGGRRRRWAARERGRKRKEPCGFTAAWARAGRRRASPAAQHRCFSGGRALPRPAPCCPPSRPYREFKAQFLSQDAEPRPTSCGPPPARARREFKAQFVLKPQQGAGEEGSSAPAELCFRMLRDGRMLLVPTPFSTSRLQREVATFIDRRVLKEAAWVINRVCA